MKSSRFNFCDALLSISVLNLGIQYNAFSIKLVLVHSFFLFRLCLIKSSWLKSWSHPTQVYCCFLPLRSSLSCRSLHSFNWWSIQSFNNRGGLCSSIYSSIIDVKSKLKFIFELWFLQTLVLVFCVTMSFIWNASNSRLKVCALLQSPNIFYFLWRVLRSRLKKYSSNACYSQDTSLFLYLSYSTDYLCF